MDIQFWRKKTLPLLEVEAVKLTSDNAVAVADWCSGVNVQEFDAFNRDRVIAGINVPTEQGMKRASEGDYIFKLVEGMFFVDGPQRFESIWESALAAPIS